VLVSKATGLPVKGENCFKMTRVKDIPWVEFISLPKIKYDYKAMQEDLEVEKEMSSIANKSSIEEPRSSQIVKKAIMKEKKKDKDSFDLDSLQKVIKTIANEMVDVKGKLLKCPIDHLYLSSRRMCKYLLVVRFLLLKVRRLMRMKKKMMNMKYEIQIFSGL